MPNILIVEDDLDIRETLGELAVSRGYRAGTVASGAAALAHLDDLAQRGDLPVLILLDLRMPGMSGLELVERLQARPDLRGIPVIILTADNLGAIKARGTIGVRAVLTKPFAAADLEAVIETIAAPPTDPGRTLAASTGELCSLCLEPLKGDGVAHWLGVGPAAECPISRCSVCRERTPPRCALGKGLFFYLCPTCGFGWRT